MPRVEQSAAWESATLSRSRASPTLERTHLASVWQIATLKRIFATVGGRRGFEASSTWISRAVRRFAHCSRARKPKHGKRISAFVALGGAAVLDARVAAEVRADGLLHGAGTVTV